MSHRAGLGWGSGVGCGCGVGWDVIANYAELKKSTTIKNFNRLILIRHYDMIFEESNCAVLIIRGYNLTNCDQQLTKCYFHYCSWTVKINSDSEIKETVNFDIYCISMIH